MERVQFVNWDDIKMQVLIQIFLVKHAGRHVLAAPNWLLALQQQIDPVQRIKSLFIQHEQVGNVVGLLVNL